MQHVSHSISELLQHIRIHPVKILTAVSEVFGVSEPVIVSKDRHRTIFLARAACCLLLRRRGFSYPEIGRVLHRDHTSAMSTCKTAERFITNDEQFAAQIVLIEEIIRPKYLRIRINDQSD